MAAIITYAMKSDPQTGAEMIAGYKAARRRLMPTPYVPPPPKPAALVEVQPVEPVPVPVAEKESPRRYRKSAFVRDKGNFGFMDIEEDPAPTIMHVKTVVAEKYKISVLELESARRTLHVCAARHIAVYLCATITRRSLPSISLQFGRRDHTTILHSRDKIAKLITADIHLNEEILALKSEILATMGDEVAP